MIKLHFDHSNQQYNLDLSSAGKSYRAAMGDKIVDIEIIQANNGKLDLLIDGERVIAYVSSDNAKRWVTIHGQTFVLTKSPRARRGGHGHPHAAGELTAPMPGQIRALNVSEGEAVPKGQTLLVLEAMKMEIRVQAPFDGVVSTISVKAGEIVEREQILVKIDHG
ncbi:MAG: biotin/lipoyl-binding protein [Anaerolineales bacterium]|nr:biotin/lipoyl-binding protein [Anaerolineales bacterium]